MKKVEKKKEVKKTKKKRAFTLIELLAVIIILGILMIIAIPSVTEYITNSRKGAYVITAKQYITSVRNKVNSLEYPFTDLSTIYYVPTKCIKLEKGGKSPFGNWKEAYVAVTFDGKGYTYYWTSTDSAGYGVKLTAENDLSESNIKSGITNIDINKQILGKTNVGKINTDTCSNMPVITIGTENAEPAITDAEYEAYYETFTPTNEKCFAFDPGTKTITAYYNNEENNLSNPACPKAVVIPKTINSVNVEKIADGTKTVNGVFANRSITSLIFPSTLKVIGNYASALNRLTSVIIPNTVTALGEGSFFWNNITDVTIGEGITTVSKEAFMYNPVSTLHLGSKIRVIDEEAFSQNRLENLTLPNGLTTIKRHAFSENMLKTVVIPDSVTTIDNYAFMRNQISSLTIGANTEVIGDSAFSENQLTALVLPAKVNRVGYSAFTDNRLESITIYNGDITINTHAFFVSNISNSGLTSIRNLTGKAFEWAGMLTDMVLTWDTFETGTVVVILDYDPETYLNVQITK